MSGFVVTLWGMTDLFQLFAVAAVVMGMSQTISKERIFAPLRERLGGKETFFGYLVSCPYCASHYVAFVLVPLTGTYPIQVVVGGWLGSVLSWFLSSILITVIAAFYRVLFWFVDESQGLVRRRQRTEEEEIATKRLVRKKVAREVSLGESEEDPEPPAAAH
ncbi:hypothetical protein [Archangium sp.]|jgi:hypothetical protein|uniref:hypothetical protein n=1 Tax=Archangium sp. TaxID=1872627 RepID=UPI002EDB6180